MKEVPAKVSIDFKTGKTTTEYIEITDAEYDEKVIKPLAKIFYEQMKRDIETGKLNIDEICDKPISN